VVLAHAHHAAELDVARSGRITNVLRNLYRIATSEATSGAVVAAAIYWTKCRLGWTEYAPAPVARLMPAPFGKKEQAEIDALTADKDSSWGSILRH
jgi:hypothetical protein